MSKVTIPWNQDPSDCLTLDFSESSSEGNVAVVHITSTPNNIIPEGGTVPVQRVKIIRFKGAQDILSSELADGFVADAVLRVLQQPNDDIVATFEDIYSIYGTEEAKSTYQVQPSNL